MKKIVRNLMFGLTAAAGALFAGCSNTDDVMDSIPYDRVLSPLNFSAEIEASSGTNVTFSWSAMQNADAYELQIFEADEEPAYDSETPVFSETVEPYEIPITVALEVDKVYYARVRGISTTVEASKWAYPEAGKRAIKTYAVRPSLNPVVVDRDQTTVTLAWDDADDKTDLTLVRVSPVLDPDTEIDFELSSAELDAAEKQIGGLDPGTNYKLTLIFGKSGQRGYVTVWTRPEAGQAVEVSTAADIVSNVQGATGEVTLLVAYNDGAEYDFTEALADPANPGGVLALKVGCDLTLIGDESVDGKKPVMKNLELSLVTGVTKIHIENLSMNGNNKSGGAITLSADADSMVPDKISAVEIINCEFYDYTKAIYSTPGNSKNTTDVDKLFISGVYAHDINANGANGGDFIDIRNLGTHAQIDVVNSTFYAVARTFLRVSDNAKGNTVNVSNCTFNFVTATDSSSNNAGIFHVRETSAVQAITCTNCLFLNMFNEKEDKDGAGWIRIARNHATQSMAPLCENNYYYRVGKVFLTTQAFVPQTGEPFSATLGWTELAADPCVNSDAGKLYLTDGTIAAKKVGDPRWWNAVEQKVERATELELVTETTTWDFTDKTKWDTETIDATTIIENIRIYAPAQVVLNEGLTFPAAGSVNASGIPTASALGFKAAGYGSVTVTTVDGGVNASVNVVAGGDRIALPADGKPHKAVFGDLTGENEIYILAGSLVTILEVTWTAEDAEAEETKTALATPAVTFDPTSITEGNEDGVEITATWAAVENAASYEVTFNGKTTEQTTTTFTISAADAATLKVGEYEISVVAKPVTTSTKYKDSAAGVASLKVKEKPAIGAPVTWTWDFSTAEWQAEFAKFGEAGADITNWNLTYDGLTLFSEGKSKYAATYFQWGGKGSTSDRYLKFEAPAAGTLTVVASNTGGSEDLTRLVTVYQDGKETTEPGGTASGSPTTVTFDVDAGEVLIYASGNALRFYSIEFTFVDGSAPAVEPAVWDFSSTEWQAEFAKVGASNTDIENWNLTYDGLTIVSTAKSKYNTTFFQWGGKGSTSDRYARFEAQTAGTLTVVASNTGGSEDQTRYVTVNQGGKETSQMGGTASGSPTTVTFDVDAGEVLIYATGNALRFYSIEFDGGAVK